MRARLLTVGILLPLVVAASGCGSTSRHGAADKAGGSTAPVVLRAAAAYGPDQPDAPLAKRFAAQVAKLSGGRLRIELVFDVGGEADANVEARIAKMVARGDYELGWIGARAWDELGVRSFQALQAPFLITNYAIFERVAKSPLAGQMLAGLRSRRVVGVALIPGLLRHPVGLRRPFLSPSDYQGARFRDIPSRATDALISALGAVPTHVSNAAYPSAAKHLIDGGEWSFANAPLGGIVTANVTFYAKALTIFANEDAFSRLSEKQRAILREAGTRTLHSVADFPLRQELAFDGFLASQFCRHPGRVVLASKAQLAALERAARPVYAELERDPQTRRMIAAIRAVGASLPQPPPIRVPPACTKPGPSTLTVGKVSSLLNGTYHWRLTRAAALAFGAPASNPENDHYPAVNAAVLRDGVVTMVSSHPPIRGTYRIVGNRIIFSVRGGGYLMTFTFTRAADGTLRLKGVPPIDRGDAWVWSGAPWHLVGAPIDTR